MILLFVRILKMELGKVLVVLCWACFVIGTSSMVDLATEWRKDIGWEITCSWNLYANDSLQSVRLIDHGRQFMIFRPEKDGPKRSQLFHLPDNVLQVDCYETTENGIRGKCVMTLELYQPMANDFTYTCEVSGERPTFRMESKDIAVSALVPPSAAVVVGHTDESTGRVTVNCSATGMPAPNLIWTIGDQKIPNSDFSRSTWNVTSKLWHVWSLLSYTPTSVHKAVCTPEISRGAQSYRGESATYNAATRADFQTIHRVLAIFLIVYMTR